MYCINCGVKLAPTEKECPLCATRVFHPDLVAEEAEPLFPPERYPEADNHSLLPQIIVSAAFLLPLLIVLLCDLQINGTVTWSGYVIGGLLVSYVILVLPVWFRSPNPVIFVPCGFAAVAVYLLYIDLFTGGGWYLTFGLPVVGGVCLIATAMVTLFRYLRRGRLYILGGGVIATGALAVLVEFLMVITFDLPVIAWSAYPLIVFTLLGGVLIFLAICRPARKMMERKFFF